jgi:DNA-directed RNA polymerase subunit M/transcription elongation factor TFIIS
MTVPPKRTCPNDGAAMVVTQDWPNGLEFTCPACGIRTQNNDTAPEPHKGDSHGI